MSENPYQAPHIPADKVTSKANRFGFLAVAVPLAVVGGFVAYFVGFLTWREIQSYQSYPSNDGNIIAGTLTSVGVTTGIILAFLRAARHRA